MASPQQISAYLDSLPPLRTDPHQPPAVVSSTIVSKNREGITYSLAQETVRMVRQLSDFTVLNPVQDVLWPGAVVQGETLQSGNLALVPLRRSPGTLVLTTSIAGGRQFTAAVDEPGLAAMQTARMDLLEALQPDGSSGGVTFYVGTARSFEQAMLEVGANYHSAGIDVKGRLNVDQTVEKNSVIVRFAQEYYTMAFEPANGRFFADEVSLDDIRRFASAGNPPCYLASVTYGRMLLVLVMAKARQEELQAAVEAAYGGGSGDATAKQKTLLSNSEVRVLTLGGSGESQVELLTDPLAGLQAYLRRDARFSLQSPGAPISYTARYIASARVAAVSLTAEYQQTTVGYADNVRQTFSVKKGPEADTIDTTIRVAAGDKVTITATGRIWAGVAVTGENGPKGWFDAVAPWDREAPDHFPVPKKPKYSLIARFGTGAWTSVGDSFEITYAGSTATLYLGMNDDNPRNGSGAFTVTVVVERAPLAPPGAVERDRAAIGR